MSVAQKKESPPPYPKPLMPPIMSPANSDMFLGKGTHIAWIILSICCWMLAVMGIFLFASPSLITPLILLVSFPLLVFIFLKKTTQDRANILEDMKFLLAYDPQKNINTAHAQQFEINLKLEESFQSAHLILEGIQQQSQALRENFALLQTIQQELQESLKNSRMETLDLVEQITYGSKCSVADIRFASQETEKALQNAQTNLIETVHHHEKINQSLVETIFATHKTLKDVVAQTIEMHEKIEPLLSITEEHGRAITEKSENIYQSIQRALATTHHQTAEQEAKKFVDTFRNYTSVLITDIEQATSIVIDNIAKSMNKSLEDIHFLRTTLSKENTQLQTERTTQLRSMKEDFRESCTQVATYAIKKMQTALTASQATMQSVFNNILEDGRKFSEHLEQTLHTADARSLHIKEIWDSCTQSTEVLYKTHEEKQSYLIAQMEKRSETIKAILESTQSYIKRSVDDLSTSQENVSHHRLETEKMIHSLKHCQNAQKKIISLFWENITAQENKMQLFLENQVTIFKTKSSAIEEYLCGVFETTIFSKLNHHYQTIQKFETYCQSLTTHIEERFNNLFQISVAEASKIGERMNEATQIIQNNVLHEAKNIYQLISGIFQNANGEIQTMILQERKNMVDFTQEYAQKWKDTQNLCTETIHDLSQQAERNLLDACSKVVQKVLDSAHLSSSQIEETLRHVPDTMVSILQSTTDASLKIEETLNLIPKKINESISQTLNDITPYTGRMEMVCSHLPIYLERLSSLYNNMSVITHDAQQSLDTNFKTLETVLSQSHIKLQDTANVTTVACQTIQQASEALVLCSQSYENKITALTSLKQESQELSVNLVRHSNETKHTMQTLLKNSKEMSTILIKSYSNLCEFLKQKSENLEHYLGETTTTLAEVLTKTEETIQMQLNQFNEQTKKHYAYNTKIQQENSHIFLNIEKESAFLENQLLKIRELSVDISTLFEQQEENAENYAQHLTTAIQSATEKLDQLSASLPQQTEGLHKLSLTLAKSMEDNKALVHHTISLSKEGLQATYSMAQQEAENLNLVLSRVEQSFLEKYASLNNTMQTLYRESEKMREKVKHTEQHIKKTMSPNFLKHVRFSLEEICSTSLDLQRFLYDDVPPEKWQSYIKGNRLVFLHSLTKHKKEEIMSRLVERMASNSELTKTVAGYITQFEELIFESRKYDPDHIIESTLYSSDIGKLYAILSHTQKAA